MKDRIFVCDGALRPEPAVSFDASAEALCLGHSLFETMLARPEGEIFRLEAHLERLVTSAARLGWAACPDLRELADWVRLAVSEFRRVSPGYGRVRLTVAWTSTGCRPKALVTVVPYTPPGRPARAVSTQVRVPWTYVDGFPAPKSGSRIAYSFAETAAAKSGCDEALLVDAAGRLAEVAKSNLFAAIGDRLVTPGEESGILPGIARGALIELAREAGVPVELRPLLAEEIKGRGSLLLTNALWGVRTVVSLDGEALPEPCGPVRDLVDRFRAVFRS